MHNLDSSIIQLYLYYEEMLSSGEKIGKTIVIPDPNIRNRVVQLDMTMREFKETNDIWGNSLSALGIRNTFESTFTVDSEI